METELVIEIVARATTYGLEVEVERTDSDDFHSVEETGRLAITSPSESEEELVRFINEGPENWDYELTTAETGVPIVYVGVD